MTHECGSTTVDGFIHGVVSIDPPTVRCCGCGREHTEATLALAVILSGMEFAIEGDRRLCAECRGQS